MKMKKLICVWGGHSSGQPLAPTYPSWRWVGQPARPWLLGPRVVGTHSRMRSLARDTRRRPVSWQSARSPSLSTPAGCHLSPWAAAGRWRKEGLGGATPAASQPSLWCQQVPCLLTRMARKTGKRRIHQKAMLSLLVQHLQGRDCLCPGSLPARPSHPRHPIDSVGST